MPYNLSTTALVPQPMHAFIVPFTLPKSLNTGMQHVACLLWSSNDLLSGICLQISKSEALHCSLFPLWLYILKSIRIIDFYGLYMQLIEFFMLGRSSLLFVQCYHTDHQLSPCVTGHFTFEMQSFHSQRLLLVIFCSPTLAFMVRPTKSDGINKFIYMP